MGVSARTVVDIGRLVDDGAWTGFQKLVIGLAALAFATDGMANQVMGLALPLLSTEWQVPRHDFAQVQAMGLVGVALGTVLGGLLGDRIGRRPSLIGSLLLFGGATAVMAAVVGVGMLGALRLLAGFGLGGAIPNGAALVAEYTPARRRGLGVTLAMLFIPIGGVAIGLLASVLLPEFGWRPLFLATGLLPVAASLVFLIFLPESPRFLAAHPGRQRQLARLLARLGYPAGGPIDLAPASADARPRAPLAALFGSDALGITLALWAGFFFCFVANYTMLSWAPSMLNQEGFGLAAAGSALSLYNAGGILGGLATGAALGRYGYRNVLLLVSALSAAGALLLAPSLHHLAAGTTLGAALGLEGIFIGGAQNTLYAMASHIYPPSVKATGVGTASSVGRLGAVASAYTGVISLEAAGGAGFFGCIAAAMAALLVAALFLKTDREIG